MCRENDLGHINRGGDIYKGLQMYSDGAILLRSSNTTALASALKVVVQNSKSVAYSLAYNGSDVFYVCAEGWIWSKQGGYYGSDKKLKKDIIPLESSLDKLKKLKGVSYRYKEENSNIKTISSSNNDDSDTSGIQKVENDFSKIEKDRKRIGLIAQEVEEGVT